GRRSSTGCRWWSTARSPTNDRATWSGPSERSRRTSAMLISSDSHVVEPGDLWTTRLPPGLRDKAPRAVQDPANHHWYLETPGGGRGVDLTLSRNAGMTV